MNEQLILLLGADPGADVQWMPADAAGQPLGTVQSGSLDAASSMAGGRTVVAFLPAERVILTEAAVPGLRGPRLRQAVPFALEDRVAADIETLHFAYDRPDADGTIEVAVVERALMDAWLAAFRGAGLAPAALVPDCLGLPWAPGETSVAVLPDRVLLRDGRCAGFASEPALFEPMTAMRAGPPTGEVAVADGADLPAPLVGARTVRLAEGLLPWLAGQAADPPLNLLQGEYAVRRRRKLELGRWRLPAALAGAWLVLGLVAWLVNFAVLSAQHRALQQEIATTFERLMPGEPLVDPRLQIERRLAGTSARGGEVLNMLAEIGGGITGVRGTQLNALSYRRGMLELTVTAQRAGQLDQLRDRLAEGRYDASIESASSRGERVEGRIQLRAGGR